MEGEILLFIKFGNKKNIEDLYNNGTLYFNTVEYFKTLEEQGLRGDNYEGTNFIRNYHKYKILKCEIEFETGKKLQISPIKLGIRTTEKELLVNLFSMYCIKTPEILEPNFKVDNRVKEFGSHGVIIKNLPKFIELVERKLDNLKIKYQFGVVNYYDEDSVNGNISLFQKPLRFKYQNEYRILIENKERQPFVIRIGSLKDYAEIFESKMIGELRIKLNN